MGAPDFIESPQPPTLELEVITQDLQLAHRLTLAHGNLLATIENLQLAGMEHPKLLDELSEIETQRDTEFARQNARYEYLGVSRVEHMASGYLLTPQETEDQAFTLRKESDGNAWLIGFRPFGLHGAAIGLVTTSRCKVWIPLKKLEYLAPNP